jgi:hypothetical protein
MTIFTKPENALLAFDTLLDFTTAVGWMDEEEIILLRTRIHGAGYSKPILDAALALLDAIEEDNKC